MAGVDKRFSFEYMYFGVEHEELLITTKDVSKMVNLSKSSLEHMRLKGGGPPYVLVGRSVRYKLSDVYDWMSKQKSYSSTSDADVNQKK